MDTIVSRSARLFKMGRPDAYSMPQFVPVKLTHTTPAPVPADIQIGLRRGATAVKITWPIAAAADCAAWMRELLR